MDYRQLDTLSRHHPAWRLLAADSAPLVLGFLHRAFVEPNARARPQREMSNALEDHLQALREDLGEDAQLALVRGAWGGRWPQGRREGAPGRSCTLPPGR
ncbi:MAG: DUF3375 family protein [Halorhodospira sp.]